MSGGLGERWLGWWFQGVLMGGKGIFGFETGILLRFSVLALQGLFPLWSDDNTYCTSSATASSPILMLRLAFYILNSTKSS